jgi:hypothetical protein
VAVKVTLDSHPPVVVDLQDYSKPLDSALIEGCSSPRVVWGISNLENGIHTLTVGLAKEQGELAIVDSLMQVLYYQLVFVTKSAN